MRRFLFIVVLIAIFLAGLYDWNHRRVQNRQPEQFTPATSSALDLKDVQLLAALDDEYTRLVHAVVPSVVSITTSKRVQTGYAIDPFELLFHHRLQGVPQEQERYALGSGVIVSKEGHILTNNHVIADMDKIEVELSDGRAEPAEIIGADPETDIAVLKIKGVTVAPLPIGNSDDVKVGQLAFAIGNPLGLQETVTRGIISAKSRIVDDSSMQYFQTDAAINQGNSGGALVNLRGELIGINTRIASQSGGSQGLGFAIPSNIARRVLESILKQGRVIHGYLGVVIQQLTPELAAHFGVNQTNGALVTQVATGSPAEKAGLRSGDVITKFNGRQINGIQDLRARVAETPVDTAVDIGIVRGNQETKLTAKIAEQPVGGGALQQQPGIPQLPQPATPAPEENDMLAGVVVTQIPADHRQNLPDNVKGVMVAEVAPDSVAANSPDPLRAGDVIEEIDHKPVPTVADYQKVVKQMKADGKQTLLFICRGKTRSFIVLTPR